MYTLLSIHVHSINIFIMESRQFVHVNLKAMKINMCKCIFTLLILLSNAEDKSMVIRVFINMLN